MSQSLLKSTPFPYTTLFRSFQIESHPVRLNHFQSPPEAPYGGAPGYSQVVPPDRKSTRLNSSHANTSYAVFCWKKKRLLFRMLQTLPSVRSATPRARPTRPL